MSLDPVLASDGDYLDNEERERLHETLRESIRQMKAGETVDVLAALVELRAVAPGPAKVEKEPPPG